MPIQISDHTTDHIFEQCIEVAKKASCIRSKCGSLIYDASGNKIGEGFNSPPQNAIMTICRKDALPKDFKSDKTCCIHAEQRAIIDALRAYPTKLQGATLYFVRLNDNGQIEPSGHPYCTICSKMALDVGIAYWVLYHKKDVYGIEGYYQYTSEEYNVISFRFKSDGK